MSEKNVITIASADEMLSGSTRRSFLRLMGVGGAAVLLPSVFAACTNQDDGGSTGIAGGGSGGATAGSGAPVTIDFAKGDIAVLQFAFALEQLEADFYTKVVANFNSNFTAADQAVLADLRNHEVIHREFLKAALGANGTFVLTPTYGNLDFKNRTAVLTAARDFEDLGVAAYNGAGQYLASTDYLTLAGKIVSVEARHASAIRDLLVPKASGPDSFAPQTFDNAFYPGKVAGAAQAFIVDKLAFANAPASSGFAQGPNNNGV